jgi:hypothetical protein
LFASCLWFAAWARQHPQAVYFISLGLWSLPESSCLVQETSPKCSGCGFEHFGGWFELLVSGSGPRFLTEHHLVLVWFV